MQKTAQVSRDWSPPERPGVYAEQMLIKAILDGSYPPGALLPGERDLARQLGVTRPTLRETLQRLDRDGWLRIRHGKATRVRDYWREGGLNVLSAIVRHNKTLPPEFVPNLLGLRLLLAPAYTRAAVKRAGAKLTALLKQADSIPDTAQAFADFDWQLQHLLTLNSGNAIFTLMLNGFSGFYEKMALLYFSRSDTRRASRTYYRLLLRAAGKRNPAAAENLTRRVMQKSISLWRKQAAKNRRVRS